MANTNMVSRVLPQGGRGKNAPIGIGPAIATSLQVSDRRFSSWSADTDGSITGTYKFEVTNGGLTPIPVSVNEVNVESAEGDDLTLIEGASDQLGTVGPGQSATFSESFSVDIGTTNSSGLQTAKAGCADKIVSCNTEEVVSGVILAVRFQEDNKTISVQSADCTLLDVSVNTLEASSVGEATATLRGEVTSLNGTESADIFFDYGESGTGLANTTGSNSVTSEETVSETISNLSSDTTYEFEAVVTSDGQEQGTGGIKTFTTDSSDGNGNGDAMNVEGPTELQIEEDGTFVAQNSPSDTDRWTWDMGDGTTETTGTNSITHSYDTKGDYTVECQARKDTGRILDSSTHNVSVVGGMQLDGDEILAPNEEGQFVAENSPSGTDRWSWDFDDGTTDTTGTNVVSHKWSDEGEYTVVCDAVKSTGRVLDSATHTLNVTTYTGLGPSGSRSSSGKRTMSEAVDDLREEEF